MHYILDGYNIIYKLPQFGSSGSIKNEREKLIKYLYKEKKHLNGKNHISIVFDGKDNIIDWQSEQFEVFAKIQILFSHQTNADDYIIELIKRQVRLGKEKPQFITVVTDDKELQTRVRMLSAFAMEVDEFFAPNKKETKQEEIKPSLTYKDLEEIKEELVSSSAGSRKQKCS